MWISAYHGLEPPPPKYGLRLVGNDSTPDVSVNIRK